MGDYVDLMGCGRNFTPDQLATRIPKRYFTLEHRHYDAGVPYMREEIVVSFGHKRIASFSSASLPQVLREAANYIEVVMREDEP